jgi:small subunit ribosomal protein S1
MVLSRRAILEREAEEAAKIAIESLHEGDVVEGEITSLQKYGAFVDVGGVEGLIHVSELSHTRVGHPDEVVSKGQHVRVQIKEIDRAKGKISLSLKSLLDDPWNEALATLSAGRLAEGKVSRLAAFGAFVEMFPGVEGLVHVSQMAVDKRVNNPREMVSVGQKVRVRVLEIDPDRRRISLALVDEGAEEEREATEEFRASAASHKRGMGTLGDLLGASLKKK